jgi:hypothetical protein
MSDAVGTTPEDGDKTIVFKRAGVPDILSREKRAKKQQRRARMVDLGEMMVVAWLSSCFLHGSSAGLKTKEN